MVAKEKRCEKTRKRRKRWDIIGKSWEISWVSVISLICLTLFVWFCLCLNPLKAGAGKRQNQKGNSEDPLGHPFGRCFKRGSAVPPWSPHEIFLEGSATGSEFWRTCLWALNYFEHTFTSNRLCSFVDFQSINLLWKFWHTQSQHLIFLTTWFLDEKKRVSYNRSCCIYTSYDHRVFSMVR
jgi:hypothetical protein